MLRNSTRERGMRKSMLAMVAVCAVLSGCADKAVPPFASAPFSVARTGNFLSIPFTVPPSAPLEYTYMLSFKYLMPEMGDPLLMFWSRPRGAHLFLKVRLVSMGEKGREEDVVLHDYDNQDGSVEAARAYGPDVFNVDIHGTRRDIVDMEIVFFKLPHYGSYRFDVETVDDLVIFEPIASWLTVERQYRHGK
jgi:hypothetical protein